MNIDTIELLIIIVHVILAVLVIGLVMIQQGKGADMGASFGGGGAQTVFGASGSGNFITKTTSIMVAFFFVTSFSLAVIARERADSSVGNSVPVVQSEQTQDIPELEDDAATSVADETQIPEL